MSICAWLPWARKSSHSAQTSITGVILAGLKVSGRRKKICTKIFSDRLSKSSSHVYPWINISFTGLQMNAVSAIEPWQGKVVEGKYPLLEFIGTGPRGPVFRTLLSGENGQ